MMDSPTWRPILEAVGEARVLISHALAKPIPCDVYTVARRDKWTMAFAETHLPTIISAVERALELAASFDDAALRHECTTQACSKCASAVALAGLRRALSHYVPAVRAEDCADKLELLRLRSHMVSLVQADERVKRLERALDDCHRTIGQMEEERIATQAKGTVNANLDAAIMCPVGILETARWILVDAMYKAPEQIAPCWKALWEPMLRDAVKREEGKP